MKVLKKSIQHNVILNEDHYTPSQITALAAEGKIYYCGDSFRVFLRDCSEIKVVCKDGYYETVVIMHDGTALFILI